MPDDQQVGVNALDLHSSSSSSNKLNKAVQGDLSSQRGLSLIHKHKLRQTRVKSPARCHSFASDTVSGTVSSTRTLSIYFIHTYVCLTGIDAEEEPPPAFAPRHSPPPPPAEPVSVAAAVDVPSSPPPSYSAELLPGPSTISTLNAPVAAETPAQTLTADEWPPLFLLPSWLDVERLPVWQEAEQDQDLLRAWRRDEISGLPLEERARRHHMLRKRRERLERRRQASISETLSQLQQRTPPPTATTQAESSAAATTAPDPESSLTAFMKATNDYIAQNFPQHDPSARQQEDSDNDEPRRSSSGSDAESDQTEPAGLKRRHPNRILPLVTPRMPAITTWDDKGEQTNANSNVLPKPGSVTMWGQDSNTRPDSGTRSPATRSPASNASSDVNEDRRELGRRHSALLVRPLSIKRKPPPIPAPRRWAQAVERASSDSPTETEDAASSTAGESGKSSERPRSGQFSTRMQALRERFENKPQSAPPIPPRRSRLGQRNSTEVPPSRPTSTIQEDAEDPQPSTVHQAPLPALPAENSLGISSSLKRAPSREEQEAARSMSSVAAAPEREDEQPSFRDSFQRISLSDAPWPLEHRESQTSQVEHVQPAPAPRADSPEMSLRPQSSPPRPSSAPVETTPQSTTNSVPEAQARPAVPAGPALEPSRSYSSQGERSPPAPPARQPSVQYTELDALASRISDQRVQTGEAYDDIVLLSEILGPHQPQRPGVTNATLDTATDASGGGPVQQQNAQKREEEEIWDSIPVLPVEEQRRRTDPKTGKTRIKLSCGGVSVNKCQVSILLNV